MTAANNNTPEIRLPVVGFEESYHVSNYGRVKNIRTNFPSRNKIRKHTIDKYGYPVLELKERGRKQQSTVHKLVALAFLGPRPSGYQVNHKDGNKQNNFVDNLEYVTVGQNIRHSVKLGLHCCGDKHWTRQRQAQFTKRRIGPCPRGRKPRLKFQTVNKIREEYARGDVNQIDLARRYDVHSATIRRIVKGMSWRND